MKNIIVTGAGGNLAEAVVKTFLQKGYHVLATIRPGKTLDTISSEPNIEVFPVNALDAQMVDKFVTKISEKGGSIDGLVLLVGGFAPGKFKDTSAADIQQMISLNFETAYNYVRPVIMQMKKQNNGGKIILMGSKPGKNPAVARTAVAYAISKSLVFRLAEIINEEGIPNSLGTKNISATVFVPGTIDTPANRKSMPDADFSKWNNPYTMAERMEKVFSGDESQAIVEFD